MVTEEHGTIIKEKASLRLFFINVQIYTFAFMTLLEKKNCPYFIYVLF